MNTMKTKEELHAIKKEIEDLNGKIRELTPEELEQVTGGVGEGLSASGKPVEIIHKIKGEIRQLGSIDNGSFSSQDL